MGELNRESLIEAINNEGKIPLEYLWEFYKENDGIIKDINQFIAAFNRYTAISYPDFSKLYTKYSVNIIFNKKGEFVKVY